MAIERREMGVVQDGLDVYQHLIETILDEQLGLQAATATAVGTRLPLGREWDQILRDLHGVIDSVSASTSRLLWVDVLSWVRRMAIACAERGVLNALGTILTLFESAWSQELAAPGADTTARQDALLLRLSEFGSFYLRLGRVDQEIVRGADVIHTRTFLRVVKHAIELGDPEAARVAIKYFLHGSTSPRSELDPVTGAGLLALYAWVLYRFDHGDQDESFKTICSQIARAFERKETFIPMLRASEQLENELGLHWWESNERGPMSGGVIQIGTYMALALMLVAGPRLKRQSIDPSSEEDVDAARRLMTVIDSWEKGSFAKARAALGVQHTHFDALKRHLTSVVEQGDAVLEETYSRLPLDPARVTAFRRAVKAKLTEAREGSLTSALLVPLTATELERDERGNVLRPGESKGKPATEHTAEAVPAEPNFGLDTLIPRWYFAETRVFAEPESLADELVGRLKRGEEERILDFAAADLANAPEITLEAVASALANAIVAAGVTSPVVVTNSYQAHALLVGRPADMADPLPTPFTAGPVVRVDDDRRPYLSLLSAGRSPVVHLLAPAPEIEGDEVLEDLAVVVGVSEVPPAEMDEIVTRSERTRIDEAVLRGSLRIRLLEHLLITMAEDSPPAIWTLPEDTW
jgi:hypothetical protein